MLDISDQEALEVADRLARRGEVDRERRKAERRKAERRTAERREAERRHP